MDEKYKLNVYDLIMKQQNNNNTTNMFLLNKQYTSPLYVQQRLQCLTQVTQKSQLGHKKTQNFYSEKL